MGFIPKKKFHNLRTIHPTIAGGYGSFVVHSLVDKLHPRIDAVKARVKAAQPQLSESKFSAAAARGEEDYQGQWWKIGIPDDLRWFQMI